MARSSRQIIQLNVAILWQQARKTIFVFLWNEMVPSDDHEGSCLILLEYEGFRFTHQHFSLSWAVSTRGQKSLLLWCSNAVCRCALPKSEQFYWVSVVSSTTQLFTHNN